MTTTTKYKYITVTTAGRTYLVWNRHDLLGRIERDGLWQRWVFRTFRGIALTDDCLRDVLDYMGKLSQSGGEG